MCTDIHLRKMTTRNNLRSAQANISILATGGKETPSDTDELPSNAVEKLMAATEALGTKMDIQTTSLHQEIASICQELHSTVSALQSASSQNTKRIDDLEHSATEWSTSVMVLETTVECLQSEVYMLKEKCLDLEGRGRRQNIRLVGIEEGQERGNPRQFCATVLREILDLDDIPRLDRAHRISALKPHEGARPRPFIIRMHHGDVKDHILRLSSQKTQLSHRGKRVHIFPDYAPEVVKKRAAFTDVKWLLKDIPDVKFGLRFPAKLWITFQGQEKSFDDPKLAMSNIHENIAPPP